MKFRNLIKSIYDIYKYYLKYRFLDIFKGGIVPQDAEFLKDKIMQNKKQMPKTAGLLDSSNQFYQNLLRYKPEKTSLQSIPEIQWGSFVKKIALDSNSSGIYLPRNQTAIIKLNGRLTPLSLFHEYFGHGFVLRAIFTRKKISQPRKKIIKRRMARVFWFQF